VWGAQVNVVGTINVFEAVRSLGNQVQGLSYASSIAVFGPPESYPGGAAGEDAVPAPRTLYGAYKLANEWTARVYAHDHGVGSVGLRPSVVFGPGRDQGVTSEPTMAMLAAASGVPYRIRHGGRLLFQYAPDVARLFIETARARSAEALVLNIGGTSASLPRLVQAIEQAAPEATGTITFEDASLPFPEDLDASKLDGLLGPVAYTPLDDGVRHTIATFRQLLARGVLEPPG
jgi:UDP-glucuronate 4-epimerase